MLTEKLHAGEFLVSEGEGSISREKVTVLSGQNLGACAVIGALTKAGLTSAFAGTGNGTIGTLTKAAGAKAGAYKIVCIEPAANGGTWMIEDPDGNEVGTAQTGSAFSGVIGFTIADGATDFVAGDTFTVTVAAGSLKVVAVDPAGTDGREIAYGILWDAVDASTADKPGVAIVRNAEVNEDRLDYGTLNSGQKTTAKANLAKANVIVRSAI